MGLPSFFKILMPNFKSMLRIPRLFVMKFKDALPDNALFETKYGESWSIKIEQIGEDYCFTHGWPQFVQYHQLQMYDFLVFSPTLEGKFVFRVSIYDLTACEKEITFGSPSNFPSSSLPEKTVIDLEDTCSPCTPNIIKVEERNSSESTSIGTRKRDNTGNNAKFSGDLVKKSGPCIVVTLRKHCRYRMGIPMKFARENGIVGKKNLRLVNSEGETWPVVLLQRKSNTTPVLELVRGWSEFWKENGLVVGRKCSLEFIPGADCIRVQQHGINGPFASH